MKIIIQRVKKSSVKVGSQVISSIGHGLNLLVCIEKDDTLVNIKQASSKIVQLRIFEDKESGKMNFNVKDVGGEILAISQFTLSWDGKKGNRPGFEGSKKPEEANKLFNEFCDLLSHEVPTHKGSFGDYMIVEIENDGPVTFSLSF